MANLDHASERAVSFEFLKEFVQSVPKHYTTLDVMTKVVVPATISNKIAYARIIPASNTGKPSFFVSHRWGCKFWFIFELIEEYMRNNSHLDPHTTFFWIDIFAVNQHPGTEQQEDLKQLARAIELSSKTLLCMDETGEVLTRIWCLYEIWKTLQKKEGSATDLTILLSSLNDTQVQDIFLSFHVTKAQATVAEDRDRIMKDIEASIGAQQMTIDVKEALDKSSEEEIKTLENAGATVPVLIKSLEKCSHLKRMAGKYSECEQYATKAVKISRDSQENSQQHLASALLILGHGLFFQNKFEEAAETYKECMQCQKEEDIDYTRALDGLANCKTRLGKYEESENLLQSSLEIRKKIDPNSKYVATSFHNLALLFWHQRKYPQARDYFQQSLELMDVIYGPRHPQTVPIRYNLGLIALTEEKFEEAEKIFREVLEDRKKMFGPEHPDVAMSLNSLGLACIYRGKLQEADQFATEGLAMRQRLLGPDHLDVKQSMNTLNILAQAKVAMETYQKSQQ